MVLVQSADYYFLATIYSSICSFLDGNSVYRWEATQVHDRADNGSFVNWIKVRRSETTHMSADKSL